MPAGDLMRRIKCLEYLELAGPQRRRLPRTDVRSSQMRADLRVGYCSRRQPLASEAAGRDSTRGEQAHVQNLPVWADSAASQHYDCPLRQETVGCGVGIGSESVDGG